MAIDWDSLVLAPVMAAFGEGEAILPATLPLYTPRGAILGFRLADAVFDEFYQQTEVAPDGGETTTYRPVLGVRLALFARTPAPNDKVVIPSTGKTYLLKDVQEDGHGWAKLVLMEAS